MLSLWCLVYNNFVKVIYFSIVELYYINNCLKLGNILGMGVFFSCYLSLGIELLFIRIFRVIGSLFVLFVGKVRVWINFVGFKII